MSSFFDRIAGAAERFPERPAIRTLGLEGPRTTSYAQLITAAGHTAARLTAAGVAAGDRVALLGSNDAPWVAAYLGALRLGAVAVPLDTAYSTAQVATILRDADAAAILTSVRFDAAARDAAAELPRAPHVFDLTTIGATGGDADTPLPPPSPAHGSDAAVILYTSGTTADPKGVVLTHANLDAERDAALQIIHVSEQDAVLGVLPLFHALAQMANLLLPLSVGARVVFLESVSSTTLLEALQREDITAFACVPQFFYLIHQRVVGEAMRRGVMARGALRGLIRVNAGVRDRTGWNPGRRLFRPVHRALGPRMRWLITGGSSFDAGILRDLYGLGFTLLNAYGLTESSGGATIVRPDDRFSTSVGQAFPGVEIRIASREGAPGDPEPDGLADGEVLIRGPIVMREYWRRPDATAGALRDGWLYTGDLGRLDAKGRLYITGRLKEIIVLSSGKNLYPEEIEAHYRQSPFIKELCVIGLTRPDAPAAERLHAVIVPDERVLRERGTVNIREIIRFELESLSVQLPAHKRILTYDISLDPLPRTTTGKIKRREVTRQAAARATADVLDRPLSADEHAWLADPAHARLTEAIAARLRKPAVPPDANLELDLNLDSMERVELLTALETREGRRVAPEVRATIFTARQMVDAVLAAPAASADEAGNPAAQDGLPWDRILGEPPDPDLAANLARRKTVRAAALFVLLRVVRAMAGVWAGVRIRGSERLPSCGPVIISPNHQTFLDGFLLAAALPFRLFRQVFFVGAAEFFETPVMAWAARAVNIVPLDPDANLVTAMRAAAAGLTLGKVLMLFPEGERTIDGTVKPFRKGVAILASHLDVPVVPVGIAGLYPLWPRGRPFNWSAALPWRAGPVTLQFGEALRLDRGDYAAGAARVRAAVVQLIEQMR